MAFVLNTDPNNLNIPLLPKSGRSSLQNLRRMAFLRWSAGEFLSAIANNRGFRRPALGFSDDDFFRGIAQALLGEYKTISYSFEALLEIVLGPYETMWFELDRDHTTGEGYLQYAPYGDYITYTSWNSVNYTVGERIEAIHPVTRKKTIARVKEHDVSLSRIYFVDEVLESGAVPFDDGVRIVGLTSGGQANAIGPVVRRDHYAFPLYGKAIVDPGGLNEEVTFAGPDPFIGRVRLVTDLANNHTDGTKIKINGGCWELIDTRARRVVVRVNCLRDEENSLPGNAYIHSNPYVEPKIRTTAVTGDTTIALDETVLETVPVASFPMKVILNPENDFKHTNNYPQVVTASAYNIATQTLTLTGALPASTRYIAGTRVRWYQSKKGAITVGASISDTTLQARCRWVDPIGVWRIDPGGVDEDVFVKKTSYQRRRLMSELTATSTTLYTDYPFEQPDPAFSAKLAVTDPVAGTIGFVNVQSVSGNLVTLSAPAGIATDINNASKPTWLEMVKDTSFTVHLEITRGLASAHIATTAMTYMLGTTAIDPSYTDHLIHGNWPQVDPATTLWRWPGPHVYEPAVRSPINTQGSGLANGAIDITTLLDPRIFLANEFVAVDFIPSTAPNGMAPQTIPGIPGTFQPKKLVVSDGERFPTQAAIDNWRFSNPENTTQEPPLLTIGTEGGFGRAKVYLFGRGATGTVDENVLYVAGIQRIHLTGTEVKTWTEKVPVSGTTGIFGGDPGFSITGGTILLDHATAYEEEVDYNSIEARTPTRAYLVFTRGFSPQYSHNPSRLSDLDSSISVGVPFVRADKQSIPRQDGFSFPLYLGGGLTLRRLRTVLELARAAGVQIEFVGIYDNPLTL